jgi:GNAT superfamily N-acetyltransferase
MQNSGELILVADYQGTLLGVLTVHVTPVLHRPTPVGRLTALVVTEQARRQGIGRSLVEAAEQAVLDRGCELIEVTTNRKRTDAHAFYERLGYEITSFRMKKLLPR